MFSDKKTTAMLRDSADEQEQVCDDALPELPEEVLIQIFGFLRRTDLSAVAQVNCQWCGNDAKLFLTMSS